MCKKCRTDVKRHIFYFVRLRKYLKLSKVIRRKYTTLPKNEKIEGGKARWRKKSQCEGEEKVGDIVTYGKLKKKKSALPQRGAF